MTRPATGIDTPTPSAICGSTPMVTNSVVPIANPPVASAMTASRKCAARVETAATDVSVAGLVTDTMVEQRPTGTYSTKVPGVAWSAQSQVWLAVWRVMSPSLTVATARHTTRPPSA
jgi:hypothetical protein